MTNEEAVEEVLERELVLGCSCAPNITAERMGVRYKVIVIHHSHCRLCLACAAKTN